MCLLRIESIPFANINTILIARVEINMKSINFLDAPIQKD